MKDTFEEIIKDYLDEKSIYIKHIDKLRRRFNLFIKLQKEIDNNEPILSKALLEACLIKRPWEKNTNRANRISDLRGLSKYMIRMGYNSIIIPIKLTKNPDYSYEPYIFSQKELKLFLIECDKFYLSKHLNIQARRVFPIVFRILVGSGTRISETLNLEKNDIDFKENTIFLKKTKNNNERKIPIAKSTMDCIKNYLNLIKNDEILNNNKLLFPNREGRPFTADVAYRHFRAILWNARIPHYGRGRGPRLHDFRHTYAVKVLEKWVKGGHNISTALPYLATYMGHSGLKASEHYLRLTRNMYPDLLDAYTHKFNWILEDSKDETN